LGRYWNNIGLVFPSSTGSYSHKSNLRNRSFNIIEKKAGLTGRTPHALRHTFASLMLMSGTPTIKIANHLGHVDMSVTMRTYAHFIPNQETDTLADDFSKLLNS
jgi:integrase